MAKQVSKIPIGSCWLANRHEDVGQTVDAIERSGGAVGRAEPLKGIKNGVPNCLHPEIIEKWQLKGYPYRPGYCLAACERKADPGRCEFLAGLDRIKEAQNIVTTKAMARRPNFFTSMGNSKRGVVILDEDPIGLLRPHVIILRNDLGIYMRIIHEIGKVFEAKANMAAKAEADNSLKAALWCWEQINKQLLLSEPAPVDVPTNVSSLAATEILRSKAAQKLGRRAVLKALCKRMRENPDSMVRNVYQDLKLMLKYAAGRTVYVTYEKVFFHLRITIPRRKKIFVLDATANPDLLKPIFRRPVEVLCEERVRPAGRVIQFMDFNGPRSYLNKHPKKVTAIIDAIGELHPSGTIVLISHKSCVEGLAKASRHESRIQTAWFGAVRGRNDLQGTTADPVACHIVVGSPKTNEFERLQLALAVFGKKMLPLPKLADVRRVIIAKVPEEVADSDKPRAWAARIKGYDDKRMQAVYRHTVTAELIHAVDRARVSINRNAFVYLVTNEPCPELWFAELCFAGEFLDMGDTKHRRDFEQAYQTYEQEALKLLDSGGQRIGNIDICRSLNRKPGWGCRYWRQFCANHQDTLEGQRKVKWKSL